MVVRERDAEFLGIYPTFDGDYLTYIFGHVGFTYCLTLLFVINTCVAPLYLPQSDGLELDGLRSISIRRPTTGSLSDPSPFEFDVDVV